ncbi:hypothetical protein CFOL_v3_09589, partial [Cephalotus follicularis]
AIGWSLGMIESIRI